MALTSTRTGPFTSGRTESPVGVFLQVAGNLAERDWVWIGIALATALYYVYLLWRFRRDNDDGWFNSGGPGRRLRGRRLGLQGS